MKLTTNTRFEPERVVTPAEAVAYVAERTANRRSYDTGSYARERAEALEGMLGRLIAAMVENGQLRVVQLAEIFDYDVSAED